MSCKSLKKLCLKYISVQLFPLCVCVCEYVKYRQLRKRYISSAFYDQILNQPRDLMWIIMKCFCSNSGKWKALSCVIMSLVKQHLVSTLFSFQAESKQRHPKPSASLMFFRNSFWVWWYFITDRKFELWQREEERWRTDRGIRGRCQYGALVCSRLQFNDSVQRKSTWIQNNFLLPSTMSYT